MPAALSTKRDEVEVAKVDRPQPRRGAPSSREARRYGDFFGGRQHLEDNIVLRCACNIHARQFKIKRVDVPLAQ
jgi:hypothetical protein